MNPRSGRVAGVAALVLAASCWGSVVVLIKIAARGLPVLAITVIEVVIAVAFLGALLAVRRVPAARPSWILVFAGVLEPGLAYPLINAGLSRTSGTHAAVIIGLESVLVVAGGALLERTRPSRRVVVAVVVTAIGAAFATGSEGGTATFTGDALVALGILTAAGYVLAAQRAPDQFDAVTATFYQFAIGGLVLVPVVAFDALRSGGGPFWGHPSTGEILAAVATGILGSAVAFLLYNWALSRVSTAMAGTSLTLIPVFGVVFSALALSERVELDTVVAVAAVLAGVVLASTAAATSPVVTTPAVTTPAGPD